MNTSLPPDVAQAARDACANLQSLRGRDPLAASTEILRKAISGMPLTPQQWASIYATNDRFSDRLRTTNEESAEFTQRPATTGDVSRSMQALGTAQRESFLRDNDLRNMSTEDILGIARNIQQWANPASPGPRPDGWPLTPQQRQHLQTGERSFTNPHFVSSFRAEEAEVSITSRNLLGASTPDCDLSRLQPPQARRPTAPSR